MNSPISYRITPWSQDRSAEWDHFVMEEAGNGTLFQTRLFLSYHPTDRFKDLSVMVYNEDRLICVVPTAAVEERPMSHPGTSCGGPVIHREWWSSEKLFSLLEFLSHHYGPQWGVRIAEPSFSKIDPAPLLWFFGNRLQDHAELSSVIDLNLPDPIENILQVKRQNSIRRIKERGLSFCKATSEDEWREFHRVLTENLAHHQTKPLHSIEELFKLDQLLKGREQLWLALSSENAVIAGAWVIDATPHCHHVQYIARSKEAPHSTVEALLVEVMRDSKKRGAHHLSLGISTEKRGRYLNQGLLSFKEQLGARAELRHLFLPKEKKSGGAE